MYKITRKEDVWYRSTGRAPCFLDLGTRWKQVLTFTVRRLDLQGKNPDIQWVGTWVVAGDILDGMGKRKIPTFMRNTELIFR
jgi:hypothetical protein